MTCPPSFLTDPIYVGSVTAQQRGAEGDLSLDLTIDPTGSPVEIGPFRASREEAEKLRRLLGIALSASYARTAAEVAECGLAEGETRP